MKKLSLVTLLLLFLCSFSIGQNFSYGIEFGGNSTNLNYTNNFDFWHPEVRYSLNGMLFIQTDILSSLSIQTGFRYVELGSIIKYEDYIDSSPEPIHVKGQHELIQSYMSIPIKLKYTFSNLPFSIFTGPEVGYLLNSQYKHDQDSPDQEKSEDNITTKLERFNIAINLGVQYSFIIGGQNLYLSSLYSYGLTDIAKKNMWASGWTTNEVSVNLGYFLPF